MKFFWLLLAIVLLVQVFIAWSQGDTQGRYFYTVMSILYVILYYLQEIRDKLNGKG